MKNISTSVTQPRQRLAIFNILAFAIMIAANALSIFLPLNGKTQMELSAQYENMFTPAGFTFSVWSVIYLFLAGFVVYQASVLLKAQHPARDKIAALSPLFIGSCLCNAGWLFAWHYGQVLLSVCIMVLYLLLLITIHQKLHLALPWKPIAEKLWLDLPFSLHLGWICVATIANITAWCVQNHWGYAIFSEAMWAVIMIATAALLALLYVLRGSNYFVGLVIAWALYGIVRKRQTAGGDGADIVITAAQIGMGLIFAAIVWKIFDQRNKLPRHSLVSQP